MKLARVAVLGVALGAGAIAAVLALNLTRPVEAPPTPVVAAAPAVETVEVLVASKDIQMGAALAPDLVTWQEWPEKGLSDQFVVRTADFDMDEDVVGVRARGAFYAGEPIVEAKLARAEQGFMSFILPEGKRAIATRISADTSAGGFILPNDRVDVIMAYANDNNQYGASPYLTETILHNVRVLAIDQTIEEQNGERVVVGQTATLELTPTQSEILTVAQQMAQRITLALRSIEDSTASPMDASFDAVHLIGGTKRNGAVTVIRGGFTRQVNSQ